MVTLAPAPSLTTAETEERSLGWHRFPPVREPGNELRAERWNAGWDLALGTLPMVEIVLNVSTDCHRSYRPDMSHFLRRRRAPIRSLVVSPCSAQVVHWLVALGRGDGVRGGELGLGVALFVATSGCCAFRGDEPGGDFGLLWWVRG
ncbi:MAG: hypothetical protein GY832_04795 [Chloroflexi bacterium]|nr:hypothetical protein [Chloroflexota bacterium]